MFSRIYNKYIKTICVFVSFVTFLIFVTHRVFKNHQNEIHAGLNSNTSSNFAGKQLQVNFPNVLSNEKIVIATVACSANNTFIYEEALVMFKSVIVSATQNHVKELEFHIYLEDLKQQSYFSDSFTKFGFPPNESMVTLFFHYAINVVPKKYQEHMIFHRRFRCGYVRAFFPTVLPTVDSLLYFDTDILITGDIRRLWAHLYQMTGDQLIGVGYNNELQDKNYGYLDKYQFGDIPHVKPKGINNGVILMNLTKMREYEWEEKLLNLYDAYSKVNKRMTIQRLMNILLYYNPGLLLIISCEFHFIHTHCDKGLTCPQILDDLVGIHLVHGANKKFEKNGTFQEIYSGYKKLNMVTEDVSRDLFVPIKNSYQSRRYLGSPCNRLLADNLFKNV